MDKDQLPESPSQAAFYGSQPQPATTDAPAASPATVGLNHFDTGRATRVTPVTPGEELPNRRRRIRKILLAISGILILLTAAAAALVIVASRAKPAANSNSSNYVVTQVPLGELAKSGQLAIDGSRQLAVNGQLLINNSAIIAATATPTAGSLGQLYVNGTDNHIYYFNGSQFVPLDTSLGGLRGNVGVGPGLGASGSTIVNTGVLSLQGQTGALNLTAGGGISINGLTIANTGVTSLTGTANQISVSQASGSVTLSLPQNIDTGATPTFSGLQLANSGFTGTIQTSTLTTNQTYLFPNASGTVCLTIGNCAGSGTGITGSGTAGRIAKFNAAQNIVDSLLSESGTTITVNGDLAVTSTSNFTGQITANGGILTNNAAINAGSGTITSGLINGQTISSAANLTGSLALATLDLTQGNQPVCRNASNRLSVCTTNVTAVTLQQAYDASVNPELIVDSSRGALTVRDASSAIGANLFEVQNNSGSTSYFAVSATGATITGNLNVLSGTISGNGSGLTTLNASNISSGTLSDPRLSANVPLLNAGQTFTGINVFSNASNSFTGSGAGLTALNASNISSGTLADARLSANVTLQGNTFNGASQLVQLTAGGILPALNASNLTALNASNISSGTLSDSRLSANVALLNGTGPQVFSGNNQFSGTVALGTLGSSGTTSLCRNVSNQIASCGSNPDTVTLQQAYDAGNTILTSSGRDLAVTLADSATDSNFLVNVASGSTSKFAIQNNAVDTFSVGATGAVLSQNSTNSTTAFQIQNSAGTSNLLVADTTNTRIGIGAIPATSLLTIGTNTTTAAGGITFGTDISLYRSTSTNLKTNNNFVAEGGLFVNQSGGTSIAALTSSGVLEFGSGTATRDTNLYRAAADQLKTDDNLLVQTASNSTTAFQVQKAAGDQLLNIDTSTTPNLITNPSFETDTAGWAAKGSGTISRDTTQHFSGNASLKMVTTAALDDGAKYNITLTGGVQYTFSTYIKFTGTGVSYKIGYAFDGSTETTYVCANTYFDVVQSGWVRLTCTFTPTSPSGTPYLFFKQSNAAAQTIYIDGAQVEASSSATAFNIGLMQLNGVVDSPVAFRNNTNSASAFQIQNSAGTTLFNVDTSLLGLDTVNIGQGGYFGEDTTKAVLFGLDTAATASLPGASAVVQGAMIYDATRNKFLAIENSSYKDICTSSGCQSINAVNEVHTLADTATDANFIVNAVCTGSCSASGGRFKVQTNGTDVLTISPNGGATLFKPQTNSTTAFQIQPSASTTPVLNVDTTNSRVGIGTNAPGLGFSVIQGPATGQVAAIINTTTTDSTNTQLLRLGLGVTSTTTNGRFIQFYGGATTDANGTAVGHVNINNNAVNYATSGADFAEYFDTQEALTPGDVVSFAGSGITKAKSGNSIVGVVSNSYGFSGNYKEGDEANQNRATVGLVGQVKTKVATSAGAIKAGDAITASAIPGTGAKATAKGNIVGVALEDFPGEGLASSCPTGTPKTTACGSIKVYVNPGYSDPALTTSPDVVQGSGENSADVNTSGNSKFADLEVSGTATIATLKVTGDATFAGDITIKGHIVTGGAQPTASALTAAGGGASVEVNGNDTAGTITIKTGSAPSAGALAKLIFAKVYQSVPRVVISPSNDAAAGLRLFRGETSTSQFNVNSKETPEPATTYQFDYLIAQ